MMNFRTVATLADDISPRSSEIVTKDFSTRLSGVKARFVRIQAKNLGVCLSWHPGAGGKAWLFTDEIIVR